MSDLNIILLISSVPIIVIGIVWIMARTYSLRLSRIDKELQAITMMLSEIPKETSLKEYIFAQDQRLRGIGDKLDTYPDTDMLQQCIQDQANQVIAFVSTHSEDSKSRVTKEDLKFSLQATNELLERILWSLRFDEDKYVDRTEANKSISNNQDNKNISKSNAHSEIRKDVNDKVSMKDLLESCDDDYDALIEYMKQTDKSGIEAQQALNAAKIMCSSA